MHLVENFALTAGVKISKPHIEPLFYPPPADKYITLHAGSGMNSKNYSHYKDVISIIKPVLDERGISILQIGETHDSHIDGTISLLGKTKLRETFFILSKSMLHLSNDSFSSHVAGFYNVPLVTLFGPTFPNTCHPFWKGEHKFFSPDYTKFKPSYAPNEEEKRIDKIFPNEIAYELIKLLLGDGIINQTEAVHLGDSYSQVVTDIVPNFFPNKNINFLKNSILTIRQDYTDNTEFLEYWIKNHQIALYIDKEVDLNILRKHKKNIKKIILLLHEGINNDYVLKLKATGINLAINYTGSSNISDVRLDLFPLNIKEQEYTTKKDLDNSSILCDNSYFKSSLMIISDNKFYSCKAYLDQGIEKSDVEKVIDSPEFYKEIEFFKIFNYGN
tara:strand:+ start:31039 stop:32202 length:1164 start_codon:yes stop_codon:yes gene_type:complete